MARWECKECGNVVIAKDYPTFPMWSDGHVCSFVKVSD
jgi:hypothetical protein